MLIWYEKYNCHHLSLAKGALSINVNWNSIAPKGTPGGYNVSVNDRRLKDTIPDIDKAKAAALRLAAKIVAEAIEDLKTLGVDNEKK